MHSQSTEPGYVTLRWWAWSYIVGGRGRKLFSMMHSNWSILSWTSVSETIRKPPLVKDKNCIKKTKKICRKMIFNMADGILTPCNMTRSWHWFRQMTAPCNVACGSGIMTVNSPSGSTLQCDTWLWDEMPLNSPKRPPYWNSTSGFDFDHIVAVDMSLCTSLRNFILIIIIIIIIIILYYQGYKKIIIIIIQLIRRRNMSIKSLQGRRTAYAFRN